MQKLSVLESMSDLNVKKILDLFLLLNEIEIIVI